MDQLIPIINELQDTYSKLNMPFIDLPQIVIIGSQSAGKSSVLENIVKQEFLPRGTGIVTRCPLILHLVHDSDSCKETRGRFLHTGDYDYYDFDDIKEEIIRQTEVLAGPEKNISNTPITLTVYSNGFPNLTLIDLPGLTKVAVESQPVDIDVQIRNMCLHFARKENSIILAISAANVDLANSDSMRFSQELDPEGKRTVCVITKLDLMDKGTDAYDILTGKILPKQLGYIGVVNRSQEDIMKGKPIEESLYYEKKFFEKHYPDIAQKNGTQFLTTSLNSLLKKHIKKCLPTLKDTIKEKINAANFKLALLGPEIVDKRTLISDFLSNFTNAYIDINDGNFYDDLEEIQGGALISKILYDKYSDILMEINIDRNLTNEIIMSAIRNTCGADKMSFSRQKAFICLVRQQIQKLLPPSLKCIEDVYETMRDFVEKASLNFPFSNFPNLISKILNETRTLINQSYSATKLLIENLITSEKVDVMCSHPNFPLGFVLKEMNFTNDKFALGSNGAGNDQNKLDSLVVTGFRVVCQNIENNRANFSKMMIHYIDTAGQTKTIIDLLKDKDHTAEEKVVLFQELFERTFPDQPVIVENSQVIINAMLNEEYKFYDDLIQYELNLYQTKHFELKQPPNKDHECAVIKTLVIEYFNMVRQNIRYYIPKLIKAFLVIHVREKLMQHLQAIYFEPDLDSLLHEDETTFVNRKTTKALLDDLENVKRRIEDIYCDQR